MGFAKDNAAAIALGGMGHDEANVAVGFDLRPLMRAESIFDSELVQAELFLKRADHGGIGLVQAYPQKRIRVLLQKCLGISQLNLGDAMAFAVVGDGVDDG